MKYWYKIKHELIPVMRYIYAVTCRSFSRNLKESKKKILVSYLSEPFYKRNDILYLNGHQNRRETLYMAEVFDALKWSYKFIRLDNFLASVCGYDIVFGVEPNFERACKNNKKALKIYYATGAYYKHQDNMVINRTDEFNKTHGANIQYTRRPEKNDSCYVADVIFQIGSSYTISTYPEEIQKKIKIIHQTCHDFKFENFLERKKNIMSAHDYLWMGSGGSILKGLDIVLDYFLQHPDLNLHVLGPIDDDVYAFYKPLLDNVGNITLYGFVDLNSSIMEEIALKCTYTIMLSGSEGCPGAVVNMMKLGCIPIVSKYSAFDGIENVGYITKDISKEALSEGIEYFKTYTTEELHQISDESSVLANDLFNKNRFINDLTDAFKDCLK